MRCVGGFIDLAMRGIILRREDASSNPLVDDGVDLRPVIPRFRDR